MRNPAFKVRLVRFLFLGSIAVAATVMAQPETGSAKKAGPRTRPQIIYHLPRSSNYAGTLHSQAKTQHNELPTDSALPTPQNSRPESTPAMQQQQTPAPSHAERHVQPKVKMNRPQARPHSFAKPPGGGNPHGNKSHKK